MTEVKPQHRCQVCLGQKKIMGLGCIMQQCHGCLGVGFINPAPMPEPVIKIKRPAKRKDKVTIDTMLDPEPVDVQIDKDVVIAEM